MTDWMDLKVVPVVYIAGPFGAPTAEQVACNVLDAVTLSLFAVTRGLSPICPHPGIMAGAFGKEASGAERERGVRAVIVQVEMVARLTDGRLWAIQTPEGGISSGTHREVTAFERAYRQAHRRDPYEVNAIVLRTWAEWETAIPAGIRGQARLPWETAQIPKEKTK